jgi:NAD(P)-dependent dehydrogenase (short-subunit alcohol dehydrogenase family)
VVLRQPIYEKDRMDPVDPAKQVQLDPALLAHIPMKRLGTPEDIAGIVVFLCSRAGAYVTGAQIPVDGGVVGCG